MSGTPHSEYFDQVVIGQPVTSDNTEFQMLSGSVQTAGVGSSGIVGSGCRIRFDDPVRSAGWYDAGWFDSSDDADSRRRIAVTLYVRREDYSGGNFLHFAWLSTSAGVMVASLAITSTLIGGLGVNATTAGNGTLPDGGWARLEWWLFEDGADVGVEVRMWAGANLNSTDLSRARGVRSGVLVGAAASLEACWFLIGRQASGAPTAQILSIDSVSIDSAPGRPTPPPPQPGFFRAPVEGNQMSRAEFLGRWNGAAHTPIDFLGVWNGSTITPSPPLVGTLWLEPWATNGAVGAPWTVTGSPTVTGKVISGAAAWTISRTGFAAGADGHVGLMIVDSQVVQNSTLYAWWDTTGTGSGVRLIISGNDFTLSVVRQSGTSRSWVWSESSAAPASRVAIRRVGDRLEAESGGVVVVSSMLTSAEMAEFGTLVRLAGGALAKFGAIRAEVL